MKEIINNILNLVKNLPNSSKNVGKNTASSLNWFSKQLSTIKADPTTTKKIIEDKTSKRFKYRKPGYIYMFRYVPPDKKELEFYDEFPVIITFGFSGNVVQGINLHYLPIRIRLILLLQILKSLTGEGETAKIKLQNLLKSSTVRKYISVMTEEFHFGGIRSKIRHITPDEFVIMSLLPVQKFKKKTQTQVYSQIRSKIRNIK